MHDAILVGIGTALNDDPQLNGEYDVFQSRSRHADSLSTIARHLPPRSEPYNLPRPVILDNNLRLRPICKLLKNFQQGNGRRPWVICSDTFAEGKRERKQQLEEAGARVFELPLSINRTCFLELVNS